MRLLLKIIGKMVDFQIRHPVPILAAALVLAGLSMYYTVENIGFETSQIDLISPENRYVELSRSIHAFNEFDTFVVAIQGPNPARSLTFLRSLAPLLENDTRHYRQVFYRVDPEQFKPWALLYLDEDELVRLKKDLREHEQLIRDLAVSPTLTRFFAGVNHEMASAMVGELFTGFLDEPASGKEQEPLDLSFVIGALTEMKRGLDGDSQFISPWNSFFSGASWDENSEDAYFWTREKRYLLLFVTPESSGAGFSDTLSALKGLRETIAQVREVFPDVAVGVTGQEALNQDEMSTSLNDISVATLLSLSGLALLLMIFWRGWRRPVLEIVELVTALSWTFGLTTLFIGHLNILSITFAPLLLGLGIDYGIHWLARYQEELQQGGQSREEALRAAMLRLGPSILLAGLTAAVSFFPLVLTGFKGLVELGEITSMGMIMTTVTTLCLLPALVMVFDKADPAAVKAGPGRPRYLFRMQRRGAAIVLFVSALAFILSLWGAKNVSYDLNMLHLQSQGAESVVWEQKLISGSDRSSMYGAMLANSMEEVRTKTRALESLPTVSEVQSVLSMLPEHQAEKIHLLQALAPVISGIGPLESNTDPVDLAALDTVLGRIRFKMADTQASEWGAAKPLEIQMRQVRSLIDDLRKRFSVMDPALLAGSMKRFEINFMQDLNDKLEILRMNIHAKPMQVDNLPRSLLERYISKKGDYLMRIFPAGDIWEPAFLGRFVHDLQKVDPDAVGDPITLFIFTRAFRDATIKAAAYAAVFIALLLLLTFRNIIQAALVMTPLIVGTIWTVGLMDAFHVNFNLANSLFLPLIVGAGVEYGIIILQRRQQEGALGQKGTAIPVSTAKGVILAGLTTTVGFGSLTISHHQGIYSLGLLAMIGSLSIMVAAVVFLPALLEALRSFLKPE